MSCCSHEKEQGKNMETKSNEENIEEVRHGLSNRGQLEETSSQANLRRRGDESANAVKNSLQSAEKRTH